MSIGAGRYSMGEQSRLSGSFSEWCVSLPYWRARCSLAIVWGSLGPSVPGMTVSFVSCVWQLQGAPVSKGTWRPKVTEQIKVIDLQGHKWGRGRFLTARKLADGEIPVASLTQKISSVATLGPKGGATWLFFQKLLNSVTWLNIIDMGDPKGIPFFKIYFLLCSVG